LRQKGQSRIRIRYAIQQDVMVWEWLIDNIAIDQLHIEVSGAADVHWMRETEVVFASEPDGRKFVNWAIQRGICVVEANRHRNAE